jgi:adenine-specific DNA-methyltransferase
MTRDEPEKLPITSPDIAAERRQRLRELFPEVFREDKIDEAALLRSLGEWVEPGKERYGLNWPGKAECMRVIQTPSIGTLRPRRDQSVNFDDTDNLIIEGDNLEVLKLLQKSYYGKVKMIYIDPPYNTGKEFIYPDNYREGLQDYLKFSGQVDAEGFKVSANPETSGRYHSKWLSMMYPRLYLARNLLCDDGVIFVSIDDHEVHNLRVLMNEVFGEENFVATCIWQKRYSRENREAIGDAHEYLVMYAANPEAFAESRNLIPLSEEQARVYKNPNNDPKGRWRAVPMTAQGYRPNQMYEIETPSGKKHNPPEGRCWSLTEPEFLKLKSQGRIYFGKDGSSQPGIVRYLTEVEGLVPWTWWPASEVGHTDESRKEIQSIFGTQTVYDTPKPTRLIKRILHIAADPDDIIVDFFAGSGTAAQAVLELNREDGGNRKFILVQLPEKTEHPRYPTIADICRERVRRVIQKLDAEDAAKDSLGLEKRPPRGFKALQLTSSNFHVWDGDAEKIKNIEDQLKLFAQHVEPGRTDEDLLYEILLKAGFPLDSRIEKLTLAGKDVFSVADGGLLLCLDRELTLEVIEAMVSRDPTPSQIICLDAGFQGNDQLKVNAVQTVKSRNRLKEGDLVFQVV